MKSLKAGLIILTAVSLFLSAGCDWSDVAVYDVTGTWEYIQYHEDNNNQSYVYAKGSITFIGDKDRGTYRAVDDKGNAFSGNYNVRVARIFMTGDVAWTGAFIDHRKIEGTWLSAGAVYEWEARR